MQFIPVAQFRPDVADVNNDFTDTLVNVFPEQGAVVPFPSLEPVSMPFNGIILGAFAARAQNLITVILGSDTDLFVLDGTDFTWRIATKEGATYNANSDSPWSFAAFGDYVIAVNPNDPPQVMNIHKDVRFRDLGGDPPRAGLVKIWGDFVCLMKLPSYPSRVHWSGLNDAEFWTVGKKNCDYQDFPDGEFIQGSTETTNPIIFMRSSLYKATFVPGSALIFSFQKIHDKRGAAQSTAIVGRGDLSFFIDDGGFYQISSDGQISPIGRGKVDRTFLNKSAIYSAAPIRAAIDPIKSLVYWVIGNDSATKNQTVLVYDWMEGQWTTANANTTFIVPIYMLGTSLEGLDKVAPNLIKLPFSLDSNIWKNGAPILGAIDQENRLSIFQGLPLQAVIGSPLIGSHDEDVRFLYQVSAQVDTDKTLLDVGTLLRRNSDDPMVWKTKKAPSYATNMFHVRARGRFHQFKLTIAAQEKWTRFSGFYARFKPAGIR